MIFGFLLALIVVDALFGRTVFGLNAQKVLLVLVLIFIGYALNYSLFHKEPYELLVQSEHITITKKGTTGDPDFPLYGETLDSYYIIYPAIHYKIAIKNTCTGFNQFNVNTWCENDRLPKCNTPGQPDSCMILPAK